MELHVGAEGEGDNSNRDPTEEALLGRIGLLSEVYGKTRQGE